MLTDIHDTYNREPPEAEGAVISVMVTLPERTDNLVTNETDFTPPAYESTPTPGEAVHRSKKMYNA